jgi:5-methylcytosine-specific restriction endonuclease McrA
MDRLLPPTTSSTAPGSTTGRCVLDEHTLVLNRSWIVINVTTVRRSIVMLYHGIARAIEPETFEALDFPSWIERTRPEQHLQIRTPRGMIPVPDVIVLGSYDRPPSTRVPFTRRNLFRRDEGVCQYCGRQVRTQEYSIDHVLPRSRSGATSWENCVLACLRCNAHKGDRTPEEANLRLLRTPRPPDWRLLVGTARDLERRSWRTFLSRVP